MKAGQPLVDMSEFWRREWDLKMLDTGRFWHIRPGSILMSFIVPLGQKWLGAGPSDLNY